MMLLHILEPYYDLTASSGRLTTNDHLLDDGVARLLDTTTSSCAGNGACRLASGSEAGGLRLGHTLKKKIGGGKGTCRVR